MTDAERWTTEDEFLLRWEVALRQYGIYTTTHYEMPVRALLREYVQAAIAAALTAPRGGDAPFAEQKTPASVPTTERPEASIHLAPSTASDAAPSSSASGGGARQEELIARAIGRVDPHNPEPKDFPQGWHWDAARAAIAAATIPVDDDRLRAIAERVEKATPGPWVAIGPFSRLSVEGETKEQCERGWVEDGWVVDGPEIYGDFEAGFMTKATAEFIAAACEDIPYLLSLIATLQARPNAAHIPPTQETP